MTDLRPRPYRWARLAREAGRYRPLAFGETVADPKIREARWWARWLPFWR